MKKIRLRKGMILYHGTSAPDDFVMPQGPAWFSMSEAVARRFVDWHKCEDPRPRILKFKVTTSPSLALLNDKRELDELMEETGIQELNYEELYPMSAYGYDGWTIPDNYGPGEADIMILRPDEFLEFVEERDVSVNPDIVAAFKSPRSGKVFVGNTHGDAFSASDIQSVDELTQNEFLDAEGFAFPDGTGFMSREETLEKYGFSCGEDRNPGLKPKLAELNRLAQTLTYYHWLKERGLSWSEIVGIKREPGGSINLKLKDGRTDKFSHVPFSDEVIFNRPIYTPAENPDSLDRFRISRDKGKTWERIAADMGFYTPDRQDRETLRQGGIIESEEGWLIKLAGPEPEPSSNPPATPIILSRDYYHATPDGMAGKSILKDGLIIPRPGKAGKAYQSPRKDFVYMSPQLYYAAIYALGGVFMGEDYSRRDWRDPSRYGYIFMVHKGDLMDVEPDEDEVGEMATADLHKRGPDWLKSMAEWDARDSYSKKDKLRRAKDGWCAYQSLIGKQLLKRLFRDQKEFLINMTGVNIANRGPVGFGAVWRLDKLRAPEISKDGSNVLEIAERIK